LRAAGIRNPSHEGNPKTVRAILDALKDATDWIKANKKAAAEPICA
jgi:ABC-type nitrate/sulfonate/bicarbonate transport system substrate-binding protein